MQKAVKEKRLKFKQYQQSRCDEDKDVFREANKRAKREVAKAKDSAYKDLYDKLDSIDGQKMIYKLYKTRERRTRDLTDIAYIKDSNGTILTDEDERWKESFETLLNVDNEREELEPTDPVQGTIPSVTDAEIKKQLSKMGRNKACGSDDLPIEAIMVIAELKPELLTYILQQIMANGIPDSWKKSKLIPIFKNKGDILECNTYRGIKLMSHFMKLWERIIEARLR